jgi:hypothetical protein
MMEDGIDELPFVLAGTLVVSESLLCERINYVAFPKRFLAIRPENAEKSPRLMKCRIGFHDAPKTCRLVHKTMPLGASLLCTCHDICDLVGSSVKNYECHRVSEDSTSPDTVLQRPCSAIRRHHPLLQSVTEHPRNQIGNLFPLMEVAHSACEHILDLAAPLIPILTRRLVPETQREKTGRRCA